MAVLNLPNILPASADWRLLPNTAKFTSPFNGTTQTFERPGARWVVALNFPNLTPSEGRTMVAFLTALRGEAGRFLLHDHSQVTIRGAATGTLTVVASGGAIITVGGITANLVGAFLAGDMVGIGTQLFMVVSDSNADASGNANITVESLPRAAIANGTAVVINKPTATFKLKDDNQASWNVNPLLYQMALSCEEVF